MVGDVPTPIRVLLWMRPGMQRAILKSALAQEQRMLVLEMDAPRPEWPGPANAMSVGEAIRRWHPDVLVLPVAPADIRQLVGDLGDAAAVFVSADSRSALSYLGDVSPDAFVRMVRSVTSHASHG
jgi:hypothetical protein